MQKKGTRTVAHSIAVVDEMTDLIAHPALVSAGNAQIFTVFGNRAASYINALSLQHAGNQIIGQRFTRIFFVDQLFHLALEQHQWSTAALRPVNAFGKE